MDVNKIMMRFKGNDDVGGFMIRLCSISNACSETAADANSASRNILLRTIYQCRLVAF